MHDHIGIVDALKDRHDTIYRYLSQLISDREDVIQKEYQTVVMGERGSRVYTEYKELMVRFVRTLCEKKHKGKLCEYVSKKYFPIEESLQTIYAVVEHSSGKKKGGDRDTNEALGILYRRQGEYEKAIDLFISVLVELS